MLSRRSVRIKVMQRLYALDRDKQSTKKDALLHYNKSVAGSYELFFFNLYALYKTAQLAKSDKEYRQLKHLKTKEDEAFSAKLATNRFTLSIAENTFFDKKVNDGDFDTKLDEDVLAKIYRKFSQSDEYLSYVFDLSGEESHTDQLLSLFRFCRNNDLFRDILDDHYATWADDKSLLIGMTKKLLKVLPYETDYVDIISPMDETVESFGRELLEKVITNDKDLLEIIIPKLENWDVERLAILDTILLKMAISEFLDFPTIPFKVTLNEYLDISKKYSTAKSKDFINGVLDQIMKEMIEKGDINKEGRGLIE